MHMQQQSMSHEQILSIDHDSSQVCRRQYNLLTAGGAGHCTFCCLEASGFHLRLLGRSKLGLSRHAPQPPLRYLHLVHPSRMSISSKGSGLSSMLDSSVAFEAFVLSEADTAAACFLLPGFCCATLPLPFALDRLLLRTKSSSVCSDAARSRWRSLSTLVRRRAGGSGLRVPVWMTAGLRARVCRVLAASAALIAGMLAGSCAASCMGSS